MTVLAVATALAMDAFAVAVATGVKTDSIDLRSKLRMIWYFAFFQTGMFVLGWGGGRILRDAVADFAHWGAFFLLMYAAQSMFRNALKQEDSRARNPTRGLMLILLSLATSLDAMAVGFGLSMVGTSILMPAVAIGLVTAMFTAGGLELGKRLSKAAVIRRYADLIGAVTLVLIGLNILRVHGVFKVFGIQ